jgi:hypothetical protein
MLRACPPAATLVVFLAKGILAAGAQCSHQRTGSHRRIRGGSGYGSPNAWEHPDSEPVSWALIA